MDELYSLSADEIAEKVKDRKKDAFGFPMEDESNLAKREAMEEKRQIAREQHWSRKFPQKIKTRSELSLADLEMGIPKERRKEVWGAILGIEEKRRKNVNYYQTLVAPHRTEVLPPAQQQVTNAEFAAFFKGGNPPSPGSPPPRQNYFTQIDKDIRRTFPGHALFRDAPAEGPLPEDSLLSPLRRVLIGYSLRNTDVGYCQSMNFLCALLLLFLEDEEDAFWGLATIIEELLPTNFFTSSMFSLQIDQKVLEALLDLSIPELSRHFQKQSLPFQLVSTQWFLCQFVNTVPTATVVRLWDLYLFEPKLLFNIAIGLLGIMKQELLKCIDNFTSLELLKKIPKRSHDADFLIWMALHADTTKAVTSQQVEQLRKSYTPVILGVLEENDHRRKVFEEKARQRAAQRAAEEKRLAELEAAQQPQQ